MHTKFRLRHQHDPLDGDGALALRAQPEIGVVQFALYFFQLHQFVFRFAQAGFKDALVHDGIHARNPSDSAVGRNRRRHIAVALDLALGLGYFGFDELADFFEGGFFHVRVAFLIVRGVPLSKI